MQPAERVELGQCIRQERAVDQSGPVQRDQEVTALWDLESRVDVRAFDPGAHPHQRVDHRIPDLENPVTRDALAGEVLPRLGAVREAPVGEAIDDDAVDLLGHSPVEASKSGLDVGDGDAELCRGQCRRERGVHIAGDDHDVGRFIEHHAFETLERTRRLSPMRIGAHPEQVIRRWYSQLGEKHLRHLTVVVLAGVHDDVASCGKLCAQLLEDRRHLDEVGPRTKDVRDHGRARDAATLADLASHRWQPGAIACPP